MYGSALFSQLKDKADEIFGSLPPPQARRNASQHGKVTPVASMSSYNCSSAPCFTGECSVHMADGSFKPVKMISKGDLVLSASGASASVLCVVQTSCLNGKEQLVALPGGLKITPWHPVFFNKIWQFPIELGRAEERECKCVYSFILESEHDVVINGVPCVTLAHNIKGFFPPLIRLSVVGDIREHPYWGTNKVLDSIRGLPGWNAGYIELPACATKRDAITGLVCGLQYGENA